ncbi:MAG: hypothetical protein Q4P66_01110 [Actinomycetaceae bacterium]|nr:hypothetical protein [Actinomycetaceae bacterium]
MYNDLHKLTSLQRVKVTIATTVAAVLMTFTLPSVAFADEAQPIGKLTSPSEAMALYKKIAANDLVSGPQLSTGDPCALVTVSHTDKTMIFDAFNAMRAFAKLPAVKQLPASDPSWKDTQEGAISMTNEQNINHGLNGGTFKCSTKGGEIATASSVLALLGGKELYHVRGLIDDPGVPNLGHRIQMLDPKLANSAFGVAHKPWKGATLSAFDMLTLERPQGVSSFPYAGKLYYPAGTEPKVPIVAWPSAGFFPHDLIPQEAWSLRVPGVTFDSTVFVEITMPDGTVKYPSKTVLSDGTLRLALDKEKELKAPSVGEVNKYTVRVVYGTKSWIYPINVFHKDSVYSAPSFTQDLPATINLPKDIQVSVPMKVSGFPDFTYQVQRKAQGTTTWTNIPQASGSITRTSYDLSVLVDDAQFDNGDQIRVLADQYGNKVYSRVATVSFTQSPSVSVTPTTATVFHNSTAPTFTATTNVSANNVTWNRSDTGELVASGLTFTPSATQPGTYHYRVIAKSSPEDTSGASAEVTFTILPSLQLSLSPVSVKAIEGSPVEFSAKANAPGSTYQWQVSPDGTEAAFTDISGATSPSYTVPSPKKGSKALYRVKVTNTQNGKPQSVVSKAVGYELLDSLKPGVVTPAEVESPEGSEVTLTGSFNVSSSLTYQWERSTDGKTWTPVKGATGQSLTLHLELGDNGALYRVVGKYGDGATAMTEVTQPAKISVYQAAFFTQQPVSQTVTESETVSFSVDAPQAHTLQWQMKAPGETSWSDIPEQTAPTTTLTAILLLDGAQFRVVTTDSKGQTVVSNPATLTVKQKVHKLTIAGMKASYSPDDTVKLTVTATPSLHSDSDKASLKWFASSDAGKTWNTIKNQRGEAQVGETLSIKAIDLANKQVKVIHLDGTSVAVSSEAVTINVPSARPSASGKPSDSGKPDNKKVIKPSLARTGLSSDDIFVWALLLLTIGAGALVAQRRIFQR